MDNNTVPYIVYESLLATNERHIKRLVIALIISIVLLCASNVLWLYEWCQYDYSYSETYEQDGEGINVIGNMNEVEQWVKNIHEPMANEEKVANQKVQKQEKTNDRL